MKKIIVIFLFFLTVACADEFKEGEQYYVLDTEYEKNSIRVLYSVYCPFCYQFSKQVVPKIETGKNAVLDEIYVYRMGEYGPAAALVLAAAKAKGSGYQEAKEQYFEEVFTNEGVNIRNKGNDNFIDIGLKAAGMNKEEYEELLKTQEVEDILVFWENASMVPASEYGIPAVIVSGKYLINISSIKNMDEFNRLIAYLLKKKE